MAAVGAHPRRRKLSLKRKGKMNSTSSTGSSNDPMSPGRKDYERKLSPDDVFLNKATVAADRMRLNGLQSYVAVAAIDFGTTYSGYAYAFTRDPENIHLMNQRMVGHRSSYGVQQPTVLLLNERGEFHSFGYEAQEFYHDLDEEESGKWLYFEKFKMELHSRQVTLRVLYMHTAMIAKIVCEW